MWQCGIVAVWQCDMLEAPLEAQELEFHASLKFGTKKRLNVLLEEEGAILGKLPDSIAMRVPCCTYVEAYMRSEGQLSLADICDRICSEVQTSS